MLSQPIEPSAEIEADIRARLGRVCKQYPTDEFNALVRQIAAIRVKYETRHADAFLAAARTLGSQRTRLASGE